MLWRLCVQVRRFVLQLVTTKTWATLPGSSGADSGHEMLAAVVSCTKGQGARTNSRPGRL
jgi:hypothetical protein